MSPLQQAVSKVWLSTWHKYKRKTKEAGRFTFQELKTSSRISPRRFLSMRIQLWETDWAKWSTISIKESPNSNLSLSLMLSLNKLPNNLIRYPNAHRHKFHKKIMNHNRRLKGALWRVRTSGKNCTVRRKRWLERHLDRARRILQTTWATFWERCKNPSAKKAFVVSAPTHTKTATEI